MKKAAVIGDPVSHSLSPEIFRWIADHERVQLSYDAIRVTAEELAPFLQKAREEFVGLSVTLPHKESALKYLDQSTEARTIGAINAIQFQKGSAIGHNTDVTGLLRALEQVIDPVELRGGHATVLGAGGAARAALYALGKLGCSEVAVLNRTQERSRALCAHFSPIFPECRFLAHKAGVETRLIINATSLGMSKGTKPTTDTAVTTHFKEMLAALPTTKATKVFDLIYTPYRTPFLQAAAQLHLGGANGLGMLIHQALAAWELWLGPLSDRRVIAAKLVKYLSGPIFLCGPMGVGKSTAGELFAKRTERDFVDLDRWIEEAVGVSIAELFRQKGEAAFRELEAEAIAKACLKRNCVVALGGGALLREGNLQLVRAAGHLIFLSAQVPTLIKRLEQTDPVHRPLLQNGAKDVTLRELLEERLAHYQMADFEVSTEGRTVAQVVDILVGKEET